MSSVHSQVQCQPTLPTEEVLALVIVEAVLHLTDANNCQVNKLEAHYSSYLLVWYLHTDRSDLI